MKKRFIIFIFLIVFFSSFTFAYYANTSNYEVRFMPGAFGSNTNSSSGYDERSNAGDYPGDTFNSTNYEGNFQDYDFDREEGAGPTPTPAAVSGGGGGGGAGGMRLTYGMTVEQLCLKEKSKISINPSANGQLIVSYEKNNKWFFLTNLDVRNGKTYFVPDIPGRYRFDFKVFNNIVASSQAVAGLCAGAAYPFALFPDVFKETPGQVKEEKEEIAYEGSAGKAIAVVDKSEKKIRVTPLTAIAGGLALVLAMIFAFRRSGRKEEKGKKKKKGKEPQKTKVKVKEDKTPLGRLDSDLSRIEKELGSLKKKYKF